MTRGELRARIERLAVAAGGSMLTVELYMHDGKRAVMPYPEALTYVLKHDGAVKAYTILRGKKDNGILPELLQYLIENP